MSEEQKLKLCRKAVFKILSRIREDEKIRHLLGLGSQAFEDLCVAGAACKEQSPREIGAVALNCKADELDLLPETVEEVA